MTDYGHDLLFGTFVTPQAAEAERVIALAQLTEEVGLDLVSVQDHPYQARFLDTWTLLSVIAARTTRIRVLPNVANLPLRPPAILARSASTLDILSGGRVELGLGSGAFWDGIAAMGGTRLSPAHAVDALDEAIRILRALWLPSARSVRIEGIHYQVRGVHPGPAPAHDIGIWLGAYKPRMLALTGRAADGWLPSSPYAAPAELTAMNAAIDAAAEAAGRPAHAIRRLYNITGSFAARGTGFLVGPAAMWSEQLAELTLAEGMSGFIVMGDDPDLIRRFAHEVAPAVRELVAAERQRRSEPTDGAGDGAGRSLVTAVGPGTDGVGRAGDGPPVSAGEATLPATGAGSSQPTEATGAALADRTRDGNYAGRGLGGDPGLISVSIVDDGAAFARLGVTPTPDDGVRRSAVRLWDEAARPVAPVPDPGRTYTAAQRRSGRHLVEIHDHLRGELAAILDLIEQVAAGALDPAAARGVLNAMAIRQNNWTLGAYCESFCRLVTAHHSIEDANLFPLLRRFDPALGPVLDRLEAEHQVIHEVLDGVDRALVALVSRPDGLAPLRAAADLLSDTLVSHLSYEERSLVEPLARLGVI